MFGALLLGEEEMYSGELVASRAAGRNVRPSVRIVGPLRGLGRICGFGGTAEAVPFPFTYALEVDCRAAGKQQIPRFARNDNV